MRPWPAWLAWVVLGLGCWALVFTVGLGIELVATELAQALAGAL